MLRDAKNPGFNPSRARFTRAGITRALALALALAGCGDGEPTAEAPPPAAVDIVQLSDAQVQAAGIEVRAVPVQELRQTVQVPGSIAPPDTAQAVVGSIVEGRVARVRVLPGDRVRVGQTLVEIHSHELADAQAELTAARAEFEYRSEAAQRAERLYDAGAVSLEELQRRRSDLRSAEAELERATEMVEHLHPTPAGDASVVAPQNGVVFTVEARPGEVVLPGTPLVHMGATDVLWVTAFVPEGTSAALEPGDEVSVTFRSPAGATARARLVRVGQYVDPQSRSVEMRFELLDPPAQVQPGSFATVDVTTTGAFQGMELPEEAAVRMGTEDVVFVAAGPGAFRAIPVRVTPVRPGTVAVEGVPDGAEVVVKGAYFLKSAMEAGTGEGEGQ